MAVDPFVQAFLKNSKRGTDDYSGGNGGYSSGGTKSTGGDAFTSAFISNSSARRKRLEEEQISQATQLKEQAKQPAQSKTKINVGGKDIEIDDQTKQNWYKLNEDQKKALKDKFGEETFNQLKSTLDKEAPKQGIFDKITDKVNANSEMDKFKRTQQGQNADYRTAQREAGQKDYTNPFQRVAFQVAEPVARGVNTLAGASAKFGQGVSDLAGVAFASDDEERRIALERAKKRSDEDIAFSGKGGLLGVGANFQNAKELEDKKKLAGTAIQTGADLASVLPTGSAAKTGATLTSSAVRNRLVKEISTNVVAGLASEGGRQLKEGKFDAKSLALGVALDTAIPVGAFGAGRVFKGLADDFRSPAKQAAQEALNKPRADFKAGKFFDGNGKEVTIGEYQKLTQSPSLTKMENDINAGGGPQSLRLDALPGEGGTLGYKTMAQFDSGLGAVDRALSKVLQGTKYKIKDLGGGAVGRKLDQFNSAMFDDNAGVNALVKRAEYDGRLDKGAADAIRKSLSDQTRYSAYADDWLKNNEAATQFRDIIRSKGGKVGDAMDDFDNYARARSELEIQKLYDETGGKAGRPLDPNKRTQLETDISKYSTPENLAAWDSFTRIYRDRLDAKLQEGRITQQEYDSLTNQPYDYIRQQRELTDAEMELGKTRQGGNASGIQRRGKSDTDREIMSPTTTMVAEIQKDFGRSLQNQTKRDVIGALEAAGEAKRLNPTDVPSRNAAELTARVDGSDVRYEVPVEVKKAVDQWKERELNALTNFLRASNNIFKYGVTGANVGFIGRNLAVDTTSALINSQAPIRLAYEILPSWLSALGVSPSKARRAMQDQIEADLGMGMTRIQQYRAPKKTSQATREFLMQDAKLRQKGAQVLKDPKDMVKVMSKVEDALSKAEIATRTAVYNATYKKALKRVGAEKAREVATQAARESTVDFGMGGSLSKTLNLASPYFNARTQVFRTLARNLEKRPASTAAKMFTLVGAPMVALTLHNTSTPEKLAIYNDIDEKTKEDYNIFISDDAKFNDKTKRWEGVTLVRRPNDASWMFGGVRKYIENVANGDPEEHANLMQILKDTAGQGIDNAPFPVTPKQAANALPPVAKTVLEDQLNKSIYYGNELVPEYLRQSSPNASDQRYDNYSRTSSFLGKLLGKSPIVIDNYIRGNLGEVGSQMQNLVDRATGGREDRVNEEGKTYSDIGGRSVSESIAKGFSGARGDETQRQFWEVRNRINSTKTSTSKKVTSAVKSGDYNRAQRLAEEYNASLQDRLNPFLKKYQNSPTWDPEWDTYINDLFIKTTPRALKAREKY